METGYEALRNSTAWIDFSTRGKIRVTGEDAGRLLHAMSTQNVKELADGTGIYSFFLTDKGRIMADANIFRLGAEYLLDTEPEAAPNLHHHLDKFIIADDAYVHDETTSWFEAGIEGPDSPAVMDRLGIPAPLQPLAIVVTDWGFVARAASTGPLGFRIWAGEDKRLKLFDALSSSGIPQAFEQDIRTVRLENGIPRYGEDITERFLVQETRAYQAVSFSKGCYLGQEIVERVRSQGKVHRLLTALRITGSVPPPEGSKLVYDLDVKPAGEITSAAFSPALNEIVALAYLRTEVVDHHPEMQVSGMDPSIRARVASIPAREAHEPLLQ